ncbi:ABC transporter F family member 4 isoform X1 [Tachysurus ichikawai]
MELLLYKGLSVVFLLHLCQAQDAALPSPSPESALHSLDDVMDAVKAAFMEAVKISENDAVRAVFDQVVEELGPQENIAEDPPATADDTEDGLPAVVHERADKETTYLSEENAKQEQAESKLNSSEQTFGLPDKQEVRHGAGMGQEPGEKPVELINRLTKSAEVSVQEAEDPVQNLAQDLLESTQEPEELFEPESEDLIGQKDAERDESQVWSFESLPIGVQEKKEESEIVKAQEQTQDTDAEIGKEGWKKDMEVDKESKIQKGELPDLAKQTLSKDQEHGLVINDDLTVKIVAEEKQNKDEQGQADVGGMVKVKMEVETVDGDIAAHIGEEVAGLIPLLKATEKTSQEQDIMHETNEIVTSMDSEQDWNVPTLGINGNPLTPSPTVGVELGENDELMDIPADKTQSTAPKQEAWKIGVIAVAFFLVLQTLVTVTYILKCKQKRCSCTVPDRVCEDGLEADERNAANADTDEQTTVEDLPDRSQIQQEMLAMTKIRTQSVAEKSFNY